MLSILDYETKKKIITFLLISLILLTACQPAPKPTPTKAVATGTVSVLDCETSWEQEATDGDESLSLILELERSQFSYDRLNKREELVLSTLTLKNMGSMSMWVNVRMGLNNPLATNYSELDFVLISPWGEAALFANLVYASERTAKDFKLLGANETIKIVSSGIADYAFPSLREEKSLVAFPGGKYCVWAVYHNQINPGLDGLVWRGKIKSNLVRFEVIKQ